MEMLALPDIVTRGNGQIGKKGCWQKKGMSGKLANIDVSARHVADMSPTFSTKTKGAGYPPGYPARSPHSGLAVVRHGNQKDFVYHNCT